jgi:hypothetical protein
MKKSTFIFAMSILIAAAFRINHPAGGELTLSWE